ncbi:MAG: IS30 family transposase, partial [Gammaproteobacteria bacterium CG22_combo_CG10-13_8_21_14_all_40_8]
RGGKDWRGKIPNRGDIEQRPKLVEEKSRTGDWEADLVSGAHHQGFLVTLVERRRKFTLIGHVPHKQSLAVQQEIVRLLKPYQDLVHTITFDNGREFTGHEAIAQALQCQCYFAKPYHSWERGLNENTNGLIRQYLPKNSDLRNVSQDTLNKIMYQLNHRPRKTLDFHTPHELFWDDHLCCT